MHNYNMQTVSGGAAVPNSANSVGPLPWQRKTLLSAESIAQAVGDAVEQHQEIGNSEHINSMEGWWWNDFPMRENIF